MDKILWEEGKLAMLYVDRRPHKKYKFIGHLVSSESIAELQEFAEKIGLKPSWFQDKIGRPHYDLIGSRMIEKAIDSGAMLIASRDIVRVLRKTYRLKE
jgi:hypothetical protein